MIAPAAPSASPLVPDATRCPDCRAPLRPAVEGQAPACSACELPLTGPAALRLWEVDIELMRLSTRREALFVERGGLLRALRSLGGHEQPEARQADAHDGSIDAAYDTDTQNRAYAGGAPWPHGPQPPVGPPLAPPQPRAEWTPKRVQNLLLGLGGLLLTIAALVFAAVTYDQLGAGGRAAVLVALTLVAGAAAPKVHARGLGATAETLGAVALVLAVLDAYGLRKLGLAGRSDPLVFAAVSAAVLAAISFAYTRFVPLRLVRRAAVVLSQLPVLLLIVQAEPSTGVAALVLAGLTAVDLAVLVALRGRNVPGDVVKTLLVCAGLVTMLGILLAVDAADGSDAASGALALLSYSALLVAAATLVTDRPLRTALTGTPVVLLAVAAAGLAQGELTSAQEPLVPAAVALLAALATLKLPALWRAGPVVGATLVAAACVTWVAEHVVTGLVLPFGWLLDPWTRGRADGAREALGPGVTWDGTVVTTIVLAAAALTLAAGGLSLRRLRAAALPVGALTAATAVLLPLGLATSFPVALGLLLVTALGLAAAGLAVLDRHREVGLAVVGTGTAVGLFAACWATADRTATLGVLPLVALLLAALSASRRLPVTATGVVATGAGLVASAALGAAGAARGLSADQVGGLLLVGVAVLAGVAALLAQLSDGTERQPHRNAQRGGLELAAVLTAGAAVCLAVRDAGWVSWVLAGTGLVVVATALLPDRRRAAIAGGLLLSASSWVRLADAGVDAPEPYVLPIALVALGLGHLRRRAEPSTRSFAAYGPGLVALLVPSLLASFDDATSTRALLLGLVALAVLLVGARSRLQAPLAVGAVVLAVDALQLLGPYAAALPRWMSLGAAGVLLVAVGATYEKRRQDMSRLRTGFDALA